MNLHSHQPEPRRYTTQNIICTGAFLLSLVAVLACGATILYFIDLALRSFGR